MNTSSSYSDIRYVQQPVVSARSTAGLLRVLIVEDETLARQRLERLVAAVPAFDLVASCGDGDAALQALQRGGIDIALLDVAIPGPDGIALATLAQGQGIACVFTTASSDRAVDAFAIEAVDFLIKPFTRERLDLALQRARARILSRNAVALTQRMRSLLEQPGETIAEAPIAPSTDADPGRGRFLVRHDGRMSLVREAQIEWIEADVKHCLLHLGNKVLRAAESFSAVLSNVSSEQFLQVNRSAAINTERVRELQELFKGDVSIVMASGTEISISRRFRARVLARLGTRV
jgi:two-component system, LytTR family, response regulator